MRISELACLAGKTLVGYVGVFCPSWSLPIAIWSQSLICVVLIDDYRFTYKSFLGVRRLLGAPRDFLQILVH